MSTWSKVEYRAVIRYNFLRGLTETQCADEMSPILGDNCPSLKTISRWYKQFKSGKFSVEDNLRPGRPVEVTTPETIAAVQKLVTENRRITYRQIQEILHISASTVHTLLHDHLRVRKLCTLWVPHSLSEEQKATRVNWCKKMLKKFESGTSKEVNSIITGDETWLYYFDVPTKAQSKVWVFEDEDTPTEVRKSRSVKKRMIAVFFGKRGIVERVVLESQRTVTSSWYTQDCLPKVTHKLKLMRPKSRLDTWFIHHDNAPAHRAKDTVAFLATSGLNVLDHPPYSPDLAPCDFGLFPEVKKRLKGRRFPNDEALLEAWDKECSDLPDDSWKRWFDDWFRRMERCIQCGGDYFEKV